MHAGCTGWPEDGPPSTTAILAIRAKDHQDERQQDPTPIAVEPFVLERHVQSLAGVKTSSGAVRMTVAARNTRH